MAEPMGLLGVIGVVVQFIQTGSQLGFAWKDAPNDVKAFIRDLQSLKTSLSELNPNLLLNKDFKDAFIGRRSALLSEPNLLHTTLTTSTLEMVTHCRAELETLLYKLEVREQGHKFGWERLKMTFLSDRLREAVEDLHRRCFELNKLPLVNTAALTPIAPWEARDGRKLARAVISWITYAWRPLSALELQHAVAVEDWTEGGLTGDELPSVEDMVAVCGGMVMVDETSGTLRLTNTARERSMDVWLPDTHAKIAKSCIRYLLSEAFSSGRCETSEALQERLRAHPLYDYAACNWGFHAREASMDDCAEVLDFLASQLHVAAASQPWHVALQRADSNIRGLVAPEPIRVPKRVRGLHLAAHFGFERATAHLLDRNDGPDPDSRTSHGRTPLSYAAEQGHETVVRVLPATGRVGINTTDQSNMTPLSYALRRGHEAVAQVFLDTGCVDVNNIALDRFGNTIRTLLHYAAATGSVPLVQRLLSVEQVDVNQTDEHGCTALHHAAEGGHAAVVQMLINTGRADVDRRNAWGRNPLLSSLAGGADEAAVHVVRALLATNAVDVDAVDGGGRTPLSFAAGNAETQVVKWLLDTGRVDVGTVDESGRTPPSYAAQAGNGWTAELLLSTGKVDVYAVDNMGRTALSYIAEYGECEEGYVQALLRTGNVDVNVADNEGRTPVSYASESGEMKTVKALLMTGKVDVNAADKKGRTPLSYAAEAREELVVMVLLATRSVHVVADTQDTAKQMTPLMYAAASGSSAIVQMLLATGQVDINARDWEGRTALHHAALAKEFEDGRVVNTVRALLAAEQVDVDARDMWDRTPLSCASAGGHEVVVKFLLDAGQADRHGMCSQQAGLSRRRLDER